MGEAIGDSFPRCPGALPKLCNVRATPLGVSTSRGDPILHFYSSFRINGRCCCLCLLSPAPPPPPSPPRLCLLPHRACQVRYTPVHQPEAQNWVCLTISVRIWASLCALVFLFPEARWAGDTRSGLCPPYLLTPKAESVGLRAGFGGKRQTHLSPSTGSAP